MSNYPPLTHIELSRRAICAQLRGMMLDAVDEAKSIRAQANATSGMDKWAHNKNRVDGRRERRALHLAYAWVRGRKYREVEQYPHPYAGQVIEHDPVYDAPFVLAWDFVLNAWIEAKLQDEGMSADGAACLHPVAAFEGRGVEALCDGWMAWENNPPAPLTPRERPVKKPYVPQAKPAQPQEACEAA